MTCEEVRALEGTGSKNATPSLYVAVVTHIAGCQGCAEWVRAAGKLQKTPEMEREVDAVLAQVLADPELPGVKELHGACRKYMERTGQ